MKLGVHSSIFPNTLNVLEKIEYTARTGFKAIELETGPLWANLFSEHPANVVARFLDKSDRLEIMEHAKSNNVKIISLCFGMFASPCYHLADPDPRFRDLAVSQIKETIQLASDFQSEVVLVFIPDTPPMKRSLSDEKKRSLLIESVLKLVRFAEDANVVIGLEPCAPSFFVGWKEILSLLNTINSKNIACYYDVGNAVTFGLIPDEEILKLGDTLTQIHIKEPWPPPSKVQVKYPSLGQGTMDWRKIFDALKSINYQRYLIVEHWPDPSAPYRVARESREYLGRYIGYD